jgi:hypothetical protein
MEAYNWREEQVTALLISNAKSWGIDNLDIIEIVTARRNGLI